MLMVMDELEQQADVLLRRHKHRGDAYYTEDALRVKRTRHELRFGTVPDRLAVALVDLQDKGEAELLRLGERVLADTRDRRIWRMSVEQVPVRVIAESVGFRSDNSVRHVLRRIRPQIAAHLARYPFGGWFLCYLETVLMRRLFEE